MIHKFRIGERTEKQHVLLLGRAAQQNSNYPESWAGLSGLVPAIHAFLGCAFIRKAWMAAISDMTPGGSESRTAYLSSAPSG
jgi:hypothetical protein